MKLKLFAFSILMLTTIAATFAQDPKFTRDAEEKIEKSRLRTVALEKAITVSPASKILAGKVFVAVAGVREKAIVEAGKTGDRSLIPLLKVLADDGDLYAQAALANFGDEEYLTRIIAETDKTQEVLARQAAVRKLVLFDHKRALKRLYELLNDTEYPKIDSHDEIFSSTAEVVVDQMPQIVKDPPRLPNGQIDETISAWKAWFERNKNLIE